MKHPIHKLVFSVRGGFQAGYNPMTGKAFKMVYQRVRKGLGNIGTHGRMDLQLRLQPPIIDKKSKAQLQGRARMAAAVLAWQGLDGAEKTVWRNNAACLRMTGFNLFISGFCKDL